MTEAITLPEGFEVVTPKEAQARFDLDKIDTIGRTFHEPILVHSGALHLAGDWTSVGCKTPSSAKTERSGRRCSSSTAISKSTARSASATARASRAWSCAARSAAR